jgi:transposase
LVGSVPHGHWKTITLVVGLRHDGMVAPFVIDGPMNGTIFLAYVEQCLAPMVDHRDVVIMDNLPAHKVAGVTDAIEAVGVRRHSICHRIHLISTRSSRFSANSPAS